MISAAARRCRSSSAACCASARAARTSDSYGRWGQGAQPSGPPHYRHTCRTGRRDRGWRQGCPHTRAGAAAPPNRGARGHGPGGPRIAAHLLCGRRQLAPRLLQLSPQVGRLPRRPPRRRLCLAQPLQQASLRLPPGARLLGGGRLHGLQLPHER